MGTATFDERLQVTVPEPPAFLARQATAKKCITDRCNFFSSIDDYGLTFGSFQAIRGGNAAAAAGRGSSPPLRHPTAASPHFDYRAQVSAATGQKQAAQREH